MKIHSPLLVLCLLFLLPECNQRTDCKKLADNIEIQFNTGNFDKLHSLTDSLKTCCPDEQQFIKVADSLTEMSGRIGIDFSLTREQVREKLANYNIEFSDSDVGEWEKKNWLEFMMINGEKRYFNRTASNLRLLKFFYEDSIKHEEAIRNNDDLIFRKDHTIKVIDNSRYDHRPVSPVDMVISYSITVEPDAVPDGEVIRCWLPWPKENHERQQDVKFISASNEKFVIAPDTMIHRTIYMEEKAQKSKATIFRISFSYRSFAQYFNIPRLKTLPYDTDSDIFKKYTSEQVPQICFTEKVKKLANSITSPGDPPAEVVRKLYMWFKENIPWTGALEYSIIPNIPEYVCNNRRGDCGMQTILFMSMLRYKGIPVRWQSGWMVPPGAGNLHDWCEIYYEGIGWVPADISYDLQFSENNNVREFYFSGIDSYRLIVNDGIAGELFPRKKFMRSEPYDFQRGEVEWSGGNLYFDKWDYEIEISYKSQ